MDAEIGSGVTTMSRATEKNTLNQLIGIGAIALIFILSAADVSGKEFLTGLGLIVAFLLLWQLRMI
jgi:hypothetical protein